MPVWPASLPALPLNDGFSWEPVDNVVASDNDVGEPIARRRFTGTTIRLSGVLLLTDAQAETLFDFWADTLAQGVLAFTMASWRNGILRQHRFLPKSPPQFPRAGTFYACPLTLFYTVTG